MDATEIRAALDRAERSLQAGDSLAGTGFWRAVEAVKGDPSLIEELGPRIADLDQRAFEPWPMLTVPLVPGTVLAVGVTGVAIGGVYTTTNLEEPWNWVIFGIATAALLGSTHGLGHLAVGSAVGIRFTKWFVAGPRRPQPGIKVDYLSYLRTPARRRAWMHAAGALVTKVIPFALIPVAGTAGLPGWVGWALAAAGGVAIVTDLTWSKKASDWKKVSREMGHARRQT